MAIMSKGKRAGWTDEPFAVFAIGTWLPHHEGFARASRQRAWLSCDLAGGVVRNATRGGFGNVR